MGVEADTWVEGQSALAEAIASAGLEASSIDMMAA